MQGLCGDVHLCFGSPSTAGDDSLIGSHSGVIGLISGLKIPLFRVALDDIDDTAARIRPAAQHANLLQLFLLGAPPPVVYAALTNRAISERERQRDREGGREGGRERKGAMGGRKEE